MIFQQDDNLLETESNGYISIETIGEVGASGFVPVWVIEAIESREEVDTNFDFDIFTIPCEDGDGCETEPVKVTSSGIISIGKAHCEIGLYAVYRMYTKWSNL